jgi:hypothetical protein
MPAEPVVHDNQVLAYTVSAKEEKIVFQTEFVGRDRHEFTDIIFEEVLAYHFEGDLFSNIISGIREIPVSSLLESEAKRFEEGRRYAWPRGILAREESIEAYVARVGVRAFEIWFSYGMIAWVLAKRMSVVERRANKAPEPTPGSVTPRAIDGESK